MKFYFSAGSRNVINQLLECGAKNILYSFAYIKEDICEIGIDYIIDSGAFTSFTKGKEIKKEQYLDFIKSFKKNKNIKFINLDVLDNPIMSLKNQKYFEKNNCEVLPVFHINENFKYLEMMIKEYPHICLGGVAQIGSVIELKNWLNKCFLKWNPKIKFHGLGINRARLLEDYPFYSIDSSSYTIGQRFGTFLRSDGTQDHSKLSMMLGRTEPKYINSKNMRTMVQCEKYITKLWEKRGVVWK